MIKSVTYSQLRQVLMSLGCEVSRNDDRLIFSDARRDLLILLRSAEDQELVRSIDLQSVRRALVGHGVIKDDEEAFDSLFLIRKGDRLIWTDPKSGADAMVTAVAGESDGFVVVKQNGRLLPCPVDQVRRVKRAVSASRK